MAADLVLNSAEVADRFKAAMRRLAATVTIVSTEEDGAWHGMTATAVTSLSMDPPSLVVSVNQSTWFHRQIARKGAMCVNLLSVGHEDACFAFGGRQRGAERFDRAAWATGPRELPYLIGAEANIFCAVDGSLDYGTHTIFVCRVERVIVRATFHPLVFLNGGFVPAATPAL